MTKTWFIRFLYVMLIMFMASFFLSIITIGWLFYGFFLAPL